MSGDLMHPISAPIGARCAQCGHSRIEHIAARECRPLSGRLCPCEQFEVEAVSAD